MRAALAFVADLLDCSDADQLTVQIDALEDLIGADRALVSGRSPGAPDLSFEVGDRAVYTRELMGAASRNWQEHPVMSADVLAGGEGARRVSDFVPRREWTRRELFNDFYRPLGMSYEVSAQLAWDPLGASCCVALHRSGRDFGARELALLEVLAPHLRLARARIARAASGEAGDLAARLPITPREAEVLALLAAGLTNDGIAADLGISRNTVARHVEHVYGKLGVHTRVAAARAALAALRQ